MRNAETAGIRVLEPEELDKATNNVLNKSYLNANKYGGLLTHILQCFEDTKSFIKKKDINYLLRGLLRDFGRKRERDQRLNNLLPGKPRTSVLRADSNFST